MKKLITLTALIGACTCYYAQPKNNIDEYTDNITQKTSNYSDFAARTAYQIQLFNSNATDTVQNYLPVTQVTQLKINQISQGFYTSVLTSKGELPCKDFSANIVCGTDKSILGAASYIMMQRAAGSIETSGNWLTQFGNQIKEFYLNTINNKETQVQK